VLKVIGIYFGIKLLITIGNLQSNNI